jgi:CheY-like chemotaxis protein
MAAVLNILHVEDNEGDVGLVERALESWRVSCKLQVAHNGFQAMELLHEPGNRRPDIIFLDINMPGMDGKKFLAARKADPDLALIPTIMLTSSSAPSDIRDCYALHANSYVVKPFDARAFIEVVRQIVAFWSDAARLPTQGW